MSKVIIKTTPRQLFDLGLWDEYCKDTGTNEWAVNEGLMNYDEEIEWEFPLKRQKLINGGAE